jgi:hypothetical protein
MTKAKHLLLLLLAAVSFSVHSQTIDGAYIKALYKNYPTQKTDFCPSCKVWVNPYYRSIADTVKHMPIVTFYVYTRAHRLLQESADIPRTGQYASGIPLMANRMKQTATGMPIRSQPT